MRELEDDGRKQVLLESCAVFAAVAERVYAIWMRLEQSVPHLIAVRHDAGHRYFDDKDALLSPLCPLL